MNDIDRELLLARKKEDAQVCALIEILQKKNVISDEDAKQILSMDPFPQTA